MTAPLFNLPITNPIAGSTATASGGQGALGGFEALLAAFFGAPADQAAGEGLFAAPSESDAKADGDTKPAAEGAAGDPTALAPTVPNDAMTLAAMLAAPQQPASTAAPPQDAEAPAPSAAPSAPFMPQLQQAAADAPPAAAAKTAAADLPADAPLQNAKPDAGAETLAPAPAVAAQAKPAPAETSPKADAKPAPPPAPHVQAAQVQQPKAPAPVAPPEAAAQAELAQAGAAAGAAQDEAAPLEPHQPARSTRHADGARRRGGEANAPSATAPANDAALPTAVTAASNAGDAGKSAASLESEPALLAPKEAKAEAAAADTPDAQPAAPAAAAAQAHAPAHAAPVRATSETIANLTAQIGKKLEGRVTKFDVELTPGGLGHVSIAVEIAASGKMTAAMSFDSPQAAAEVRARSHELQRALEQAGFDLAGGLTFDVNGERGGDGRGLAQQQQQNDGASRGRAFQAVLGTAGEAAESAAVAALQYARRSETGVDIRI
jgi:flagellar hook-length control protein FliK